MCETNYTQLQQVLYSQINPQSNECVEVNMIMLGEPSLPEISSNAVSKAPNETGGDSSGVGHVQERTDGNTTGANKENQAFNSRLRSSVRVRLEDRFNMLKSEESKSQKAQHFSNNSVTLIHHLSPHVETQHYKYTTEGSTDTRTLQFSYACNSLSTSVRSSHTQGSGAEDYGCSMPMQEEAKLWERSLSGVYSFCYQQEGGSAKISSVSERKMVPKQVCNKFEDALGKQVINQRSQSPQGQVDTGIKRKPLSELQNLRDYQAIKETEGAVWSLIQYDNDEPALSIKSTTPSQSKGRKNLLERERRRKIRMCCDKLNALVPFCTLGTDKATTLQWTVTFLKYIQKHHGDSIKKEFETIYSEKQQN